MNYGYRVPRERRSFLGRRPNCVPLAEATRASGCTPRCAECGSAKACARWSPGRSNMSGTPVRIPRCGERGGAFRPPAQRELRVGPELPAGSGGQRPECYPRAGARPGRHYLRLRAACGRLSRSARLTFAMAIPGCPHGCASWTFLPTARNSIPASSSGTSSRTRPATRSLQRYAPCERKWATRFAATGRMQNLSSA